MSEQINNQNENTELRNNPILINNAEIEAIVALLTSNAQLGSFSNNFSPSSGPAVSQNQVKDKENQR